MDRTVHDGSYRTEFDNIRVTGPADILPSIYITAPNDGGFLRGGSPAGINWQCVGPNIDHIRIQYSDDNGATFADLVANSGHYLWDVPDEAVQDAIIRVQAESANNTVLAYDQSDKSFPILPNYIAFVDNFDDGNAAGWITYGPGAWNVVNSEYQYDISNAHWVSGGSVTGNMQWSDYVFEVDFKGIRGVDKGFLFRNSPSETYYVSCRVPWSSWTSSDVVLGKIQDGGDPWLVMVDYPFNNEQWYHLTIVAIGSRIQVFVDGNLVADKTDDVNPILTGRIGLSNFTSVWDVATTAFDNVKVTGPSDILPFIYLTSPNDGGFLRGGSPAGINWQCWGPNVDHIRIQYSDDNGATYVDLATVANTGHYLWDVPATVVQDAIIRVLAEAADNTILASDHSEKSFPILPTYAAFTDDFEDGNSDGWQSNGDGTWTESNGVYTFACSGFPASGKSLTGNTDWADYVVEADIKGSFGINKYIWIREEHACNTYTAVLLSDPHNQVLLIKYIDCVEQFRIKHLLPFTVSNGELYHMTVAAIKDRFQVFIDGHLAIDTTDTGTEIANGRIGLGGYVHNGSYQTEFDNVVVWGNVNTLLPETEELLSDDYDTEVAEAGDINIDNPDIRDIIIDYVSRSWQVIVNWPGSELRLSVYRPDGTLTGEWQSTEPPIIAEFIPDTTGTWQFKVTAIDVPYNNYPYALVAGSLPLGAVSGTVANGSGNGTEGVTVDLYSEANELLGYNVTDQMGYYSFSDLLPGLYDVTLVSPLGFIADAESKPVTVVSGQDSIVKLYESHRRTLQWQSCESGYDISCSAASRAGGQLSCSANASDSQQERDNE